MPATGASCTTGDIARLAPSAGRSLHRGDVDHLGFAAAIGCAMPACATTRLAPCRAKFVVPESTGVIGWPLPPCVVTVAMTVPAGVSHGTFAAAGEKVTTSAG